MKTSKFKTLPDQYFDFRDNNLKQGYESGIVYKKDGVQIVTRCRNCGNYQKVSIGKRFITKLFNLFKS